MADFRLGRLKFNWRGAWAPSEAYVIDDIISFKGNTYVCVVNHTSASTEGAWAATDLNIATPRWQLHVPGIRIMGAWTPNTFYAENDLVAYGANQYLCVNNHTSSGSETSFYTNDVANFSVYTEGTTYTGDWGPGTWYKLNDIVKYGNTLYLTSTAHTSGISFDLTKFTVYLESVNFEDSWAIGTEYQPGDIVTFGGYSYIAKTINIGKQPNIYATDTPDPIDPQIIIPADWNIVTTGFDVQGEYDNATVYVPGDVVQFGGNTYVKITTGAAGVYPIEATAWSLVSSGLNWRGPWSAASTYQINDVVSKQSASWVCLTPHNINIDPVADGGTNWQAVAQGESTLTLQDPGDILYRNNAGANVNLSIGAEGEILTVDAAGLPAWERNNLCANVYYVATDGTDAAGYGRNISKPFATIRYALSQLPAASASSINTIFVKSGTYEEQLPLTVPAYTSIVGDNLRATIVAPDPNTSSTDATPVENRFSTMWILSESTTLKDMIFNGMEGFTPAGGVDSADITQATIRGVFLRLNPNTPILGKSPYITQCSAFSGRPVGTATNCQGGVGALIDKSIYGATTSNGCMLFDSFTQFHDLGVGFHCANLGNAEIVSSFTYYCHIGYTCTGGGRIRSLAGNNSWGTFGCVSSGYDTTEVPVTGTVRGQRLNFTYDENSAEFRQYEEVTQGTADGVATFNVGGSTTVGGAANGSYSGVVATGGTGTGAKFDVTRDGSGAILSVTVENGNDATGGGYTSGDTLVLDGALIGGVTSTDDVALTVVGLESNFDATNANYALALILYTQSDYLIIEPITGTFTDSNPCKGTGAAAVVASGATGITAAGGATPALEGIKGKIFPLTNLPVGELPRITGATRFLNAVGVPASNDSGYYVIKEVVDASTASALSIDTKRQYDVPGTPPTALDIDSLSRTSNVSTVVTTTSHGLTTGDEVTVVIANTSPSIKPYATGYDAGDGVVLGIRGGVLQRSTVTVVNGTTFTYANTGSDSTINSGDSLLTGAQVYLQGTSGGSTKALHTGGSSVTLYNADASTALLNATGVAGIDNSLTSADQTPGSNLYSIPFADESVSLLSPNGGGIVAGANNFLLINNELMQIDSVTSASCVVVRAQEGTSIASHADGSVIYYIQKVVDSTTLRGDVDTAVTQIPLFSISGFNDHDIAKVDNEFFRIVQNGVNSPQVGQATVIFAQPKNINAANNQSIEIRLNYSQVRLTGHDFLQIGTGSKLATNWPDTPTTDTIQENEVVEDFPGRVYYVSTDQDGNFRVGEYFVVEQATGTATLDASAFNLSGLASLRLGTLGAELGVAINEFSSDVTLGGEFARDSAVPTQLAVKTYVDAQSGAGISRLAPIITPQSITSAGLVATVNTYQTPDVFEGDFVTIAGAVESAYNGTFEVIAVDSNAKNFSYNLPSGASSPATGTLTVERKQKIASDLRVDGLLEVNPTWNEGNSIVENGLTMNVTDTLSAATSKLMDLQVGGSSKLSVDKSGNVVVAGNLQVTGTSTTVSSTDLTISDVTITVADGASDSATADGAGILVGSTSLGFVWSNSDSRWNLGGALDVGGAITTGGAALLSSTTLGSTVTGSSLTSLGTLGALNVGGKSDIRAVTETQATITSTTGVVQYDFNNAGVFRHTANQTGAITIDLRNVPETQGKVHSIAIIAPQGTTAYEIATGASEFAINQGTPVTVNWTGGSAPSGTADSDNVYNFTIINTSSTATPSWKVYGSKADFS